MTEVNARWTARLRAGAPGCGVHGSAARRGCGFTNVIVVVKVGKWSGLMTSLRRGLMARPWLRLRLMTKGSKRLFLHPRWQLELAACVRSRELKMER